MTFKKVCKVENNQVVITLPPDFVNKRLVTVVVEDIDDSKTQKLAVLKDVADDPLFMADIEEVQYDFNIIDNDES